MGQLLPATKTDNGTVEPYVVENRYNILLGDADDLRDVSVQTNNSLFIYSMIQVEKNYFSYIKKWPCNSTRYTAILVHRSLIQLKINFIGNSGNYLINIRPFT